MNLTDAEARALVAQLEGVHGMIRALPDPYWNERRAINERLALITRTIRQAIGEKHV